MSRSKRVTRSRSPSYIVLSWLVSIASLGLLYAAAKAVLSDFASFRSCNSNVGLTIHSCGKNSLDVGDVILIGLFILSACLVVSLFTASWRMIRKDKA